MSGVPYRFLPVPDADVFPGLSQAQRCVLAVFVSKRLSRAPLAVGVGEIAARTGLSESAATAARDSLVDDHYLVRSSEGGGRTKGGRGKPASYAFGPAFKACLKPPAETPFTPAPLSKPPGPNPLSGTAKPPGSRPPYRQTGGRAPAASPVWGTGYDDDGKLIEVTT